MQDRLFLYSLLYCHPYNKLLHISYWSLHRSFPSKIMVSVSLILHNLLGWECFPFCTTCTFLRHTALVLSHTDTNTHMHTHTDITKCCIFICKPLSETRSLAILVTWYIWMNDKNSLQKRKAKMKTVIINLNLKMFHSPL